MSTNIWDLVPTHIKSARSQRRWLIQNGHVIPVQRPVQGSGIVGYLDAAHSKASCGAKGRKARIKRPMVICPEEMTKFSDEKTRAIGEAQAREAHALWGSCNRGTLVGAATYERWYYPAYVVTLRERDDEQT